jgi:hypothetical protein
MTISNLLDGRHYPQREVTKSKAGMEVPFLKGRPRVRLFTRLQQPSQPRTCQFRLIKQKRIARTRSSVKWPGPKRGRFISEKTRSWSGKLR